MYNFTHGYNRKFVKNTPRIVFANPYYNSDVETFMEHYSIEYMYCLTDIMLLGGELYAAQKRNNVLGV